ncbi:uncharacterized protein LOC142237467 [Haematobia irritans]|uniref:uncharacterized protein LOC142237467 n=1 Tax=Haematobia irritans TaxID=7368 RepID=UPI003F4F4BF5
MSSVWTTTTSGLETNGSTRPHSAEGTQNKTPPIQQRNQLSKSSAGTNHQLSSGNGGGGSSLPNILSFTNTPLTTAPTTSSNSHGVTALQHSNNSAIHIGVAVGAASTVASSILAHSGFHNNSSNNSLNGGGGANANNHNNNNTNNNNNNNNNSYSTYHRQSLSQSQILSYSPPNPNKH